MKQEAAASFGGRLKSLREAAGFTQEELATIAGLSVHAVSALERGERRRPHVETVRALSTALDLTGAGRDAFVGSARSSPQATAVDELTGVLLPAPLTPLVGREADVRTLRQWLADPAGRLITLAGPAGVGKTRLALELARAVMQDGSTRVRFVSLAVIRDPSLVAAAIAESLGLVDVTALDLPRRLRVAFQDHATLLVLDNFEHVLETAPVIADLLTSVASLRVLATSRAPLRLRGERVHAVEPLELEPGAEAMAPADLARTPAVRLFLDRIQDVQPEFRLTSANAAAVAGICRRLDALPLALELAAPWMKVLTADGLLRRLEQDVLPSDGGRRDLPERQQTMNATVAWSYQLLGAEQRHAFRRFGALPGVFPIAAAAAVLSGRDAAADGTDAALRAAADLFDMNLLLRAETAAVGRPLFRMLETVRAYAAVELAASGERDEAMEGLVRFCTDEASLAIAGLVGLDEVEWLDRTRENLASFRAALTWLVEHDRAADAAGIAWGLTLFWVIRGHAAEGLRWYEQILNLPSLLPGAASRAHLGASAMLYTQGELGQARTRVRRGIALAERIGDGEAVVQAEWLFGYIEHAAGNLDAAREWFERAREGFKAAAASWGTGDALTGMAWVALAAGDNDEAERLLGDASASLHDAGPWFLSLWLYIRAVLAVRRGNADEAIALLRESLHGIRELHDNFAYAYALVPLAAAASLEGDDGWVAKILGTRDALSEGMGPTIVDKTVEDLPARIEREARTRLGPESWAAAYGAGRRSSIDAVIGDIDVKRQRMPA
ncbi:MAG TPA: helix-turn-helix domain-containing protein [Vicinamibacterales bacterium]|nr:helix-turn-helix domain-containing protein [Vicinamibacterales bacterium]